MKSQNKKHISVNAVFLLGASFIWGTAFVAQTTGGDALGSFGFNCIRTLIATLVLIPVIKLLDKLKLTGKKPETKEEKRLLWTGGICCGAALCVASNLQQIALNMGTGTGKAGFLTALYILMVPILGLFFKRKCSPHIWIAVAIALVGMRLLCHVDSWRLDLADILLILCAFVFSIQIMSIDHFAPLVDNVRLACIQFLVCGVLTLPFMVFADWHHSVAGFLEWGQAFGSGTVWISLLYAAVMSSGVAYTFQIIGQNNFNPTIASMLMSLESVFSALAGWLLLNQKLSSMEILGCVLIFAAIIFAQLPMDKLKKK